MCSTWRPTVLAEIDELARDRLVRVPARDQAQHLDLALGEAGGARAVDALRVARRVQDRLGRLRVEPAVGDLALEHVSCFAGVEGGAMGARFGQRVVDVGRGQHAGGERQRGGAACRGGSRSRLAARGDGPR